MIEDTREKVKLILKNRANSQMLSGDLTGIKEVTKTANPIKLRKISHQLQDPSDVKDRSDLANERFQQTSQDKTTLEAVNEAKLLKLQQANQIKKELSKMLKRNAKM